MHKTLHRRDDSDRLYVSRKEEGRELADNYHSVNAATPRLKDNIKNVEEDRLRWPETILQHKYQQNKMTRKKREEKIFVDISSDKQAKFHKKTWIYLRKRNLKRENKSFLRVAQNNVIKTYCVKAKIDQRQQNNRWRLCNDKY